MLPTPPQVLAALGQATRRPAAAEWSNDGGQTWTAARLGSGQVNADRSAEARYSASAELLSAPTGRGGINTEATRIRLRQGVAVARSDPWWFPAGTYVVDRVRQGRVGVAVDLLGLEDPIRTAVFPTARTVGPASARVVAEQLVGEALPGVPVSWRSGVDPATPIPATVVDEDRWSALSSGQDSSGTSTGVAQALAGEVWVDARGVVCVGPVPTLADPVVWRIPYGTAVVEPSREQSAEGLVNLWAVTGDGGDGSPTVGPVYAWDDDPNSLTYAGPDPVGDPLAPQRLGLTGVRLRVARHSSPLITTVSQAQAVARAKLADSLGSQSSLSFTAACHPGLEPGDVVEAEIEPGVWERHIIDSFSYTLGAASMSCQTRTTTRRL